MINLFLKARHWQLFLFLFGIPAIFQIVMMSTIFVDVAHDGTPPVSTFNFMGILAVVMIFFMAIYFAWFWSIAIGLGSKIPESVVMKTRTFKVFFFIPIVYILFFLIVVTTTMSEAEPSPLTFILIVPLHLFCMFCIFHNLYFVAKVIKTVELQREALFGDFVGEFFLMWFYPIGVWIIQPKINRMIKQQSGE